jgi:hypothetical protein
MQQYLMPSGPHPRTLKPLLLIPFATLLVLHPLLIHGPSCGQDLAFHIQSWLDAAHQLRHGTLYPHWDATAAWNAGEPRFLFYPPLSWLLGALLTLIFPINLCPTIFIAIALLLSGLTFHKLASEFASPNAALIASTLYLANPYMLFTAFERSALAELLAAAWIPLLLLALLRPRPAGRPAALATIRSIAIPLALLWLTNAPAAVIGSYTLALIVTLRVAISLCPCLSFCHSLRESASRTRVHSSLHLAITYVAAATLGLTLPALYLLPAAYERRFIQTAMALLPNMRYQDNFLFTLTADAAHNAVNHTISLLALILLLLTAAAVLTLLLKKSPNDREPVILSEGRSPQPKEPEALHPVQTFLPFLARTLALLTAIVTFLLTPLSTPIWHYLPNLAYLQFPWRLLILLTPILALTLALLIDKLPTFTPRAITALTLLLPLAIAVPAYRLFHQPPDPTDDPTHLAQLFATHHGFPPTDEYTPTPRPPPPSSTPPSTPTTPPSPTPKPSLPQPPTTSSSKPWGRAISSSTCATIPPGISPKPTPPLWNFTRPPTSHDLTASSPSPSIMSTTTPSTSPGTAPSTKPSASPSPPSPSSPSPSPSAADLRPRTVNSRRPRRTSRRISTDHEF